MKTVELIGAALDWAVAKAEGASYEQYPTGAYFVWPDGTYFASSKAYSADWSQGGPIIERECIQLVPGKQQWFANNGWTGLTPLIAAMRCYVASKLGDEVDIPKELL